MPRAFHGVSAIAAAQVAMRLPTIAFAKSQVNRNDVAFAGTPVATPISLRGTVSGDAFVLGAGLNWRF